MNDEVRQQDSIGRLVLDVPALIEHAASVMTLYPGDVIFSGTPPKSIGPVRPGDVMHAQMDLIGEMSVVVARGGPGRKTPESEALCSCDAGRSVIVFGAPDIAARALITLSTHPNIPAARREAVMTTTLERGPKTTLKIIDADTHLTEPHDLWTKRAPAALRERVPQVKMHDGKMSWVIDGDKSIGTGAHPSSAILKDGSKVRDLHQFLKLQFEDVHLGSSQVKERLAVMDEAGIYAQIVYPNILGFGGQAAAKVDAALRLSCVQIYNDAMAEMQQESGQRLFPMALLPWWDVKAAVKETERAHKLGLRGININSDPHTHKDENGKHIPDLASEHWDPLWEVVRSAGHADQFPHRRQRTVGRLAGSAGLAFAWHGN